MVDKVLLSLSFDRILKSVEISFAWLFPPHKVILTSTIKIKPHVALFADEASRLTLFDLRALFTSTSLEIEMSEVPNAPLCQNILCSMYWSVVWCMIYTGEIKIASSAPCHTLPCGCQR
jgi:hypothetical protein